MGLWRPQECTPEDLTTTLTAELEAARATISRFNEGISKAQIAPTAGLTMRTSQASASS